MRPPDGTFKGTNIMTLCYSRREALAYIAELTYPLGGVE